MSSLIPSLGIRPRGSRHSPTTDRPCPPYLCSVSYFSPRSFVLIFFSTRVRIGYVTSTYIRHIASAVRSNLTRKILDGYTADGSIILSARRRRERIRLPRPSVVIFLSSPFRPSFFLVFLATPNAVNVATGANKFDRKNDRRLRRSTIRLFPARRPSTGISFPARKKFLLSSFVPCFLRSGSAFRAYPSNTHFSKTPVGFPSHTRRVTNMHKVTTTTNANKFSRKKRSAITTISNPSKLFW